MPIYEYACQKCGNEVDVLQKMDDPAPTKCEKCGAKNKMVRRVSRTSFVLKGGGWGADLYGSKKGSSSSTAPAAGGSDAPSTAPAATSTSTPAPAASTSTTSAPASSSGSSSSTPAPKAKTEKAKK